MYIGVFWGSTISSQQTSLQMEAASIQITSKIILEQNDISLFKIGHRKHWLELPKVDRGREPMFPLSV